MGSTGAIIMGAFGAALFIAGLGPAIGWTNPLLLISIAIFGAIVSRVVMLAKSGSAKIATPRSKIVIMWSTIGEGIAIFVVANVLVNVGHRDLILPGIVAVVGAHFLPMAFAIPFRAFYVPAVALLAAATAGVFIAQPAGAAVAGVAAALALWWTSYGALMREAEALSAT